MYSDKYGNPVYQQNDLVNLIYQNKSNFLEEVLVELTDSTLAFSKNSNIKLKLYQLDNENLTVEEFDKACQSDWFIPESYKTLDIEQYLIDICPVENQQRLIEELSEFRTRNMIMVLKTLKYIVDTLRQHNIFWGVGRGSSVASYALYLLGVHKIDSVKYNLHWQEFLR
jgi:DNA polymerase III alpha subunit